MSGACLNAIRALIQQDVGNRGLRTDPSANLVTASAADFEQACRSLATTAQPVVAIVTGFFIPHAQPPCAETDGPLGALFLARAFLPLGFRVVLATDSFCVPALQAGLRACGLEGVVPLVTLPDAAQSLGWSAHDYGQTLTRQIGPLTHLIALERVGPSHTAASLRSQPGSTDSAVQQYLREVPADQHDRCHTMRGRDITPAMSPAHLLFEAAARHPSPVTTIGIGDGGNEIGMGKIAWDIIRRNIPGGGLVACRVPADHLIVCGISNWGAYGLAAGVSWLRQVPLAAELCNPTREEELLALMVRKGPLVDGVSGQPTLTVDGLAFAQYGRILRQLEEVCQ